MDDLTSIDVETFFIQQRLNYVNASFIFVEFLISVNICSHSPPMKKNSIGYCLCLVFVEYRLPSRIFTLIIQVLLLIFLPIFSHSSVRSIENPHSSIYPNTFLSDQQSKFRAEINPTIYSGVSQTITNYIFQVANNFKYNLAMGSNN